MNLVEIDEVSIVAAILGGFILIFGFVSLFIKERLYLSEARIIVGPVALGVFVPQEWGDQEQLTKITMQFCRIVIAIQVMAAGVSLPKAYLLKELKSILCLIFPVMGYMWLVSALIIWLLISKVDFLNALVIAACVSPTDPILANSIVKGKFAEKHVPPHVRNVLSAESGANDGLAFPLLFMAIYLMTEKPGDAIAKWVYVVWLYEILFSCVIGLAVGYVARKLLYLAETNDDLLACFIAGNSITWDDWFRKETEESHFQEIIDMLLNMAVFVFIGATMPWSSFSDLALGLTPWRLTIIAVLILLFRRLPIILILYRWIPAIQTYREAVFSGWFGPIGVSAIFYATFAQQKFDKGGDNELCREIIVPIVYFIVLTSALVHGCTIPVFKISQRINTASLSTPFVRLLTATSQDDQKGVNEISSTVKTPLPAHLPPSAVGASTTGNNNTIETTVSIGDEAEGANSRNQKDKQPQRREEQEESRRRPPLGRSFSVYDEVDNIIIEDEDGAVIPRNPSQSSVHHTPAPSTSGEHE
ncbi:2716_t:CDS:10 [Ambispora leptoticha]|uniref:2716_t:CDS:1 n=1 Tax=Ambispora leptoticha TaxID=144679 RepID=A0A9N8Z9X3_9GLOM|nr:2716_t:CDS:10 [Ambispora leptoticha]